MSEEFVVDNAHLRPPPMPVESPDRREPTLLVLGAGPKAISIAAKKAALKKLGYPVPRVAIIDRRGVAAHRPRRLLP